ncbi:MAG: type III secretion inner membrane ring lipoprotein SctJ [Desulfovibrionaceae bacterium]|jgi:type III secretion protein J|nr:type III secretion inner membrane ring lipoprotein SctJ [Desulfovibrionaceae bacterium]
MKSLACRSLRVVAPCLLLAALAACSQQELYGQLDETQANQVVAALQGAGIRGSEKSSSSGGKGGFAVSVSASDFARAVEVLSARGLPRGDPRAGSMCAVFKKEGFVSSPLEERARFMCARSEELSNVLSNINGVVQANVLVSVPEKNPLADKPALATASVLITYRPEVDLSQQVGQIKALVVNAVEGLPYDNVTVMMSPAEPMPPALSRSAWTAMWMDYGALFLVGGGIGVAALVAGLVMWMRQRHARKAGADRSSVAIGSGDGAVHRQQLRAVGLDGSRPSPGV